MVLFIISFLYSEFLSTDYDKNVLFTNIKDKFKDYIYRVVFEYSGLFYIMSLFFISNSGNILILMLIGKSVNIHFILNNFNIILKLISLVILIYTLNNLSAKKYETYTISEIRNKLEKTCRWEQCPKISLDIRAKYDLLVDIEDKSFFRREKSYNMFSFEFIDYKIEKAKNSRRKISNIFNRFIRGYGTIEMQIIRTLGVKCGYDKHKICRKIFEILYSDMFFRNYRKNANRIYLDTQSSCSYKEYLIYIYLHVAKVKINKKIYNNMYSYLNIENIEKISKEEFFICVIGLSHRKIELDLINIYWNVINKHGLDINKLEKLINNC